MWKLFVGQVLGCCRFYPTLANFGHRTSELQERVGVQLGTTSFEHPSLYLVLIRALVCIGHHDLHLSSAHLLPVMVLVWQ